MEKAPALRLIQLKGSPYEIGFQHGEALSIQIKDFVEKGIHFTSLFSPTTMEEIKKVSRAYLYPIQTFSPPLAEELRGIADGSGVSIDEIIFLHLRAEFMFRDLGCTTFALSGTATKEGQIISGQNLDWDPAMENLGIFLNIIPIHGPSSLVFTHPGMVGYFGINSEGLSVSLNLLVALGNQVGVPPYFFVRKFLEKERVSDCLAEARLTERSSARNFLITDAKGTILDLETTANDFGIIDPKECFLVHTNHFLIPKFAPVDKLIDDLPDSPIRKNRMEELIRENVGKITLQDLKKFLADHYNHPNSICRHPDGSAKSWKTVLSVIYEPEKGLVHALKGNPCENKNYYFTYRL
ncbi:MAG: C45 family peptidase [Thermodesulfobacteriota bacterium]|jgi:isopenicillin-N N-acyltransferase-like protein